jgi:hypothetical protein
MFVISWIAVPRMRLEWTKFKYKYLASIVWIFHASNIWHMKEAARGHNSKNRQYNCQENEGQTQEMVKQNST